MALSQRREKILQAVVDSYINTCEPISSAEIKSGFLPELSGATIRNELAILEELGYLTQPHTSAGRVPTKEAYKLYVTKLMPKHKLSRSELEIVNRYFDRKLSDIDEIVKRTAKVISEITNLTGVVYRKNMHNALIEAIKIVKMTDKLAIFAIATDQGVLTENVEIGNSYNDDYYIEASEFISTVFKGKTLEDASNVDAVSLCIREEFIKIFNAILSILKEHSFNDKGDLILEGSTKLLEQPEYKNINKAKAMLHLLDAKNELYPILDNSDEMNLSIKIGLDNEFVEGVPECAIVTVGCSVGGKNVGNAGVIGPMRMDYSKVVSVLEYIGHIVNSLPDGK